MSQALKKPKNPEKITTRGSVRLNYKGGRKKAFQIRASESEMILITHMARRYTDGNVGRWLRFAAMNFELTAAEQKSYASLLKKAGGE